MIYAAIITYGFIVAVVLMMFEAGARSDELADAQLRKLTQPRP
jgi:hypothetical protein